MSSGDTTFFYAPPEAFSTGRVDLPPDEAHHAVRVLRLKRGDKIQVVDGVGGWYSVQIESIDRNMVQGSIEERKMGIGEPAVYVHLAVAGPKSRSRFDQLVEKATELGVSRITVLKTERSERLRLEKARAERLIRAAMKQCKRSRLPVLEGPVEIADFATVRGLARKLVCEGSARSRPIVDALQAPDRDVILAVGPEGGFTEAEIRLMVDNGFEPVRLGTRRLRTETASMVGVSAIILTDDSK